MKYIRVFLIVLGIVMCIGSHPVQAKDRPAEGMLSVGFGEIVFPQNISNDEAFVKSIYFAVKREAKRLKKVYVDYDGRDSSQNQYKILVNINEYKLIAEWEEPYASTHKVLVSHRYRNYKNSKGEQKTAIIRNYKTEPENVFGKYVFKGKVTAVLKLVDVKTGQEVLVHGDSKERNKEIDAFISIVKDFYKKAGKYLKNKAKKD